MLKVKMKNTILNERVKWNERMDFLLFYVPEIYGYSGFLYWNSVYILKLYGSSQHYGSMTVAKPHEHFRNAVGQWSDGLTYNEGDDDVDLLTDALHVPLPKETWQADLGTLCKHQKPYLLSVSRSSCQWHWDTASNRVPGQMPKMMQRL